MSTRARRTLVLLTVLMTGWVLVALSTVAVRADASDEPVEFDVAGPASGIAGRVASFELTATSADGPATGLVVDWYRSGDGSGDDAVPDASGVTDGSGTARHDFTLPPHGTVVVRVVASSGDGSVLLDETREVRVTPTCQFSPARCSPPVARVRLVGTQETRGRDRLTVSIAKNERMVLLSHRNVRLFVARGGRQVEVGSARMLGPDRSVSWTVPDAKPRRERTFFAYVPYGRAATQLR